MINVSRTGHSGVQTDDSLSEQEAQRIRNRRGLRTLAHDLAEMKRNQQKQNTKATPPPQKMVPQKAPESRAQEKTILSPTPHPAESQKQNTHYREELEKLAAKYIPEKNPTKTSSEASTGGHSKDALKSFEINKAFNDQLHKKIAPDERKPEEHTKTESTPALQQKPVETKDLSIKEETHKKEPEKKLTDLTEEDITRELERVLHPHEQKDEEHTKLHETEVKQNVQEEKEKRPVASVKQLEETLYSIVQRIQTSTSRLETYREEERTANTSLKNLFERRDIINKNLDPIKEKERNVLAAIKNHEEKEASATNKVERREAENRRWEQENERRELEDERWKLEEIFEKLRLVIEKTEYELASVKKKIAEEEAHKEELEAEKLINETHRSLLTKREEHERSIRKRTDVEDEITNLKNELKVIRSGEESLEKDKRELESKIGALNDLSIRRSLEKDRREIEDKLHEIEEKRWGREDELKKHYAEKDERDREINLLATELESLENKFEELDSAKQLASKEN
jgi:chromosome segregation ATPase